MRKTICLQKKKKKEKKGKKKWGVGLAGPGRLLGAARVRLCGRRWPGGRA